MRKSNFDKIVPYGRLNCLTHEEQQNAQFDFPTIFAIWAGYTNAAPCGNTESGFEAWKRDFAIEAAENGIGARGLNALANAEYATRTISADRNQRSFSYSLERFMELRGADSIIAQGRRRIAQNAEFYASLEQRFGVPAEVIVSIHGMETAFGGFMGDSNVASAITTLAYDCRRSDFFTPHALAALKLIDQGSMPPNAIGARHGEWGHTQFLPGNVLKYGIDANQDGHIDLTNINDALASTANYLRQKGWQSGAGYQEGQINFQVIKEWNAAGVYQKAIAIIAERMSR